MKVHELVWKNLVNQNARWKVYRTCIYLTQNVINVTEALNVLNMTSKIRIVAMFVNLDWQPIILMSCTHVFAVYYRGKFHLPNSNVSLVITIKPYDKKKMLARQIWSCAFTRYASALHMRRKGMLKLIRAQKPKGLQKKMFVKIVRTTEKSKLLDKIFAKLCKLKSQENHFICSRVVIFCTDRRTDRAI
jgi:hypothetical protein